MGKKRNPQQRQEPNPQKCGHPAQRRACDDRDEQQQDNGGRETISDTVGVDWRKIVVHTSKEVRDLLLFRAADVFFGGKGSSTKNCTVTTAEMSHSEAKMLSRFVPLL